MKKIKKNKNSKERQRSLSAAPKTLFAAHHQQFMKLLQLQHEDAPREKAGPACHTAAARPHKTIKTDSLADGNGMGGRSSEMTLWGIGVRG